MTDISAASQFYGATDRLGRKPARPWPMALVGGSAVALAGVAGIVCAMGGMPEAWSFFAETHEVAVAVPQVAAITERRAMQKVVTPPVGVPTTHRLERHKADARSGRIQPKIATASLALPTHLLGSPLSGETLGFEKRDPVLTADAAAPLPIPSASVVAPAPAQESHFATAEPAPVVPVPAPAPAPVRVAAAIRTEAPQIQPVETARDALEAALVPTPSARPADAPAILRSSRTRARAMPSESALAYARPDAGDEDDVPKIGRGLFGSVRPGNGVAVYDIAAATVYLPNGEKLEAHSGLGSMRDDVRFVHQKMRGPTPPHVYDLTMRESLFHGVEALRLNPVGGERRIYNRVGLLAHTYMLGKRGDSNGCVSFKDYKRFLAAFKRGEVKRLVVVARMSDPVSRLGALFARR